MTGTVLDVEPQDFVTSSGSAAATSRAIASAGSSLRSALASSSHMAGSDPAGRKWATQYDAVAADAVAGIDALDTAFGQIAAGLAVTGLNYATAEWLSAGRSGHAPGYSVPSLPALACSATPPSSSGGTGGSTIPGWHYVADFIGEMWPDGDTGKLRAAEAAWKAFADDLDSIRSGSASRIISDLDGTVTPEMATITSTVTTVGSHLDELAQEARNLGSAAGALATQIDHVHQQTEQVLVELGEQIAATAAVGIGLTIVTAGLSDAAGALAAGGEIAAAVARILGFIAELGTNVARVVDDIAVSAGSIARVAGISEQITIRVVTIAGNSVVTGLGGAVTNVGAAEIVAPGANLGDAAIEGFIGGATLGIAGGAAKYAIKSVAKLADFKIMLKVWSRRNGPDGYRLFGDLSEKDWFDKYFVGFTEKGYPDWAWPAEHGFDGKMSEVAVPNRLKAGDLISRLSPVGRDGSFASTPGTDFRSLSLPPDRLSPDFVTTNYEVLRPLPPEVLEGPIAPSFEQAGRGTQYFFPDEIQVLVDAGYLKVVP